MSIFDSGVDAKCKPANVSMTHVLQLHAILLTTRMYTVIYLNQPYTKVRVTINSIEEEQLKSFLQIIHRRHILYKAQPLLSSDILWNNL